MLDVLESITEWLSLAGVTFGVVVSKTGDVDAALVCAVVAGSIKFAAVRLHRRLWQKLRSMIDQQHLSNGEKTQ